MIKMTVTQHDRIEPIAHIAATRRLVRNSRFGSPALKQAAIKHDARVVDFNNVAGAGDGAGGAEETDEHGLIVSMKMKSAQW